MEAWVRSASLGDAGHVSPWRILQGEGGELERGRKESSEEEADKRTAPWRFGEEPEGEQCAKYRGAGG